MHMCLCVGMAVFINFISENASVGLHVCTCAYSRSCACPSLRVPVYERIKKTTLWSYNSNINIVFVLFFVFLFCLFRETVTAPFKRWLVV